MLNVFLGRIPFPNYRLAEPSSGELQTIVVKEEVRIPFSKRHILCFNQA